ncbi:histone deacetylase [Spirochaetota bacterium]
MSKTAFLYDDIYLEHDTGMGHPERSHRLAAINERIKSTPYYSDLLLVEPGDPDMKYIEMIHSKKYIERAKMEIEGGARTLDSMDTTVCKRSYEVALKAVGGSLKLCDIIMGNEAVNGFCAVRPPGHHAEEDFAAGFCIFNNIAIAAKYLQSKYGLGNIAIIDWDVHHGNGTQHSLEYDNTILYVSLHQYPHYPGTGSHGETGKGDGKGYTLNYPMSAGSDDKDYLNIFNESIIPSLNDFKPEIVLISAGFDAAGDDPLSSIRLSTGVYYDFTKLLMGVSKKYSNERIIAFLEGGYDLNALADGVENVMKAFIEG